MLGEPHEIESEPIEHDHLVHDRGVQARHVHARFRRVAEIVDGADAKGWSHDARSPLVWMFAESATGVARSRNLRSSGRRRPSRQCWRPTWRRWMAFAWPTA